MLEMLAKIGLLFSQPIILASIVLIGFLNRYESIFGKTFLILLFTMIYNVYLKSIWQTPLPAPLEGWAFPSGHMHSAVVFWGALAMQFKQRWFTAVVGTMLCAAGYGLVYHGYHYPIDIAGALGFGSLTLILYYIVQKHPFFNGSPYRLGVLLAALAMLLIFMTVPEARKLDVWQAFGALLGFTLGWFWLSKQQRQSPFSFNAKQRLLVISIALLGSIAYFYALRNMPVTKQTLIFCQFFGIATWVSTSKLLAHRLFSKMDNR